MRDSVTVRAISDRRNRTRRLMKAAYWGGLILQTLRQNRSERHDFNLAPFAVGDDEILRGLFVTGPYGVSQNLARRSQRFLPSRISVWKIRPLLIDDDLPAGTNVKVEPTHSNPSHLIHRQPN